MRAIKPLLLGSLLLVGFVQAQVYYSNNVPPAKAIKAASRLRRGMWQEDAEKVLQRNGLTNYISVGAQVGWNCSYSLADGSQLVLDYTARELRSFWGGNGVLERASIWKGTNEVSITFTNRP